MEKTLSPQHQLFADYYLQNSSEKGVVRDSAIYAGFSEKSAHVTGSRLLKNAKIAEYIEDQKKKIKKRLENKLVITREKQIKYLDEVRSRCMQHESVLVRDETGIMIESGEYKFDGKVAINAIQEVNKMLGYDKPEGKDESESGVTIINNFIDKTSRD